MEIFRSVILTTIADPTVARVLTGLGMIGITAEFLRPGSIWPGAVGSAMLLAGLRNAPLDAWVLTPALIMLAVMLPIAARARRNKRTTATLSKGTQS